VAKGARSKADSVYGELKEAILSGALEPGCLIDKAVLCEKLGVSRFPVSAAVARLAYDKLVDVAPQHGSFVSRVSLADVQDRLFVRSALEGEVAAEAARRFSDADKDSLAENIAEAAAAVTAGNMKAFYEYDVGFHHILTSRLAMPRTNEILDGLRVHLERARRLMIQPPGRMREVIAEHKAVADAIAAGDPEGAREAIRRHLGATGVVLRKVAEQRPELFSP
jgi:GntR family transcriptional regulator, rspAB operon transcriptional repressor